MFATVLPSPGRGCLRLFGLFAVVCSPPGEARLREVCDYLFPPSLVAAAASTAAGAGAGEGSDAALDARQGRKLFGHSRRVLLGELIKLMRMNRVLQRLAAEYELLAGERTGKILGVCSGAPEMQVFGVCVRCVGCR